MKKTLTMRLGLLLLLTSFLSIHTYSQEHIIELNRYEKIMNTYNFSIDSIVDVRKEKNCIGYVYKGINNKLRPAFLGKPLGKYLNEMFDKKLVRDENSEHIILRINRLFIYECRGSNTEFAYVDLNMSFLIEKEGKYFEKYQASAFISNIGIKRDFIEVTAFHDLNIVKAINECFQQYKNRNDLQKFKDGFLKEENDIEINPLVTKNYVTQSIKKPQRGIYETFYDFRDYTIDSTKQFIIENISKRDNFKTVIIKNIKGELITDIWGFSDGNCNYIRSGDHFFSLHKKNNSYIFYDHLGSLKSKIMEARIIDSIFFSTHMNLADNQNNTYKIDLTNSQIHMLDYPEEIDPKSKLIVYYSKYSKTDTTIQLFTDDLSAGLIKKGTYKVLNFSPVKQEVNLCFELNDKKECIQYALSPFNVRLCLVKLTKHKISIANLEGEVYEKLLNKLKTGQYNRIE